MIAKPILLLKPNFLLTNFFSLSVLFRNLQKKDATTKVKSSENISHFNNFPTKGLLSIKKKMESLLPNDTVATNVTSESDVKKSDTKHIEVFLVVLLIAFVLFIFFKIVRFEFINV